MIEVEDQELADKLREVGRKLQEVAEPLQKHADAVPEEDHRYEETERNGAGYWAYCIRKWAQHCERLAAEVEQKQI